MPSRHMIRYPVDFYPSQAHELDQLILNEKIKRARFLRECVIHILSSPTETQKVVKQCRTINYKRIKDG